MNALVEDLFFLLSGFVVSGEWGCRLVPAEGENAVVQVAQAVHPPGDGHPLHPKDIELGVDAENCRSPRCPPPVSNLIKYVHLPIRIEETLL